MPPYEIDPFWITAFWIVIGLSVAITVYGTVVLAWDYFHENDPLVDQRVAGSDPLRLARPRVGPARRAAPPLSGLPELPHRNARVVPVTRRRPRS